MGCGQPAGEAGFNIARAIVESAVVDTPILIGWLRPLVILPLAAVRRRAVAGSRRRIGVSTRSPTMISTG